ncbi:hypothetical protein [Actinophytocola sediminis]
MSRNPRTGSLGALLRELRQSQNRTLLFTREAVGDALRTARREAGGADLRGLAYRIGLPPHG